MAKFVFNKAKNASTSHTPFKLNCGYHPQISYKEDINSRSKSKSVDELLAKLEELMTVCRKNFYYAQ